MKEEMKFGALIQKSKTFGTKKTTGNDINIKG
jgi:hypothetical protein